MPRGDGRLNLDLDPAERGPQDACGVFGVWSGDRSGDDPTEVAKLTYFGLYALQHRGQESAGIAVSNGSQILVYKDMGLVAQVFDESHLSSLRGHLAIGHTRYSTTGSSVWENAQPTFRSTAAGSVALGHNGNLTNTGDLLELVEKRAAESGELPYDGAAPSQDETRRWREGVRGHAAMHSTTDTEIITALLASYPDRSLEQAALEVLPQLRGAFSLVFMDEETLYAARDPQGIRPLVLGRLERGWVVAQRDRRAGHRRRRAGPRDRAGRADRDRRARPAVVPVRRGRAQGLPVRVRLPGPAGHQDRRPVGARHPGRGRPPAGPGGAGRRRPGDPGARVGHPGGGRLLAGQRHPVRPRAW